MGRSYTFAAGHEQIVLRNGKGWFVSFLLWLVKYCLSKILNLKTRRNHLKAVTVNLQPWDCRFQSHVTKIIKWNKAQCLFYYFVPVFESNQILFNFMSSIRNDLVLLKRQLMMDAVEVGKELMPHRTSLSTSDSQASVPTTPIRKLSRNRGLVMQEQSVDGDSPERRPARVAKRKAKQPIIWVWVGGPALFFFIFFLKSCFYLF